MCIFAYIPLFVMSKLSDKDQQEQIKEILEIGNLMAWIIIPTSLLGGIIALFLVYF